MTISSNPDYVEKKFRSKNIQDFSTNSNMNWDCIFLNCYIKFAIFLSAVLSLLSKMYEGVVTWLTSSLKSSFFKKLNRIHFADSRIIIGDWKCQINKELINQQTRRLLPQALVWCHICHHQTLHMSIKIEGIQTQSSQTSVGVVSD